jgi:hypothetical protein
MQYLSACQALKVLYCVLFLLAIDFIDLHPKKRIRRYCTVEKHDMSHPSAAHEVG